MGEFTATIDSVTDITPQWLTKALRLSGLEVDVASVAAAPVGTGQMATSYRVVIDYASGDGPSSIVAKLPALGEQSRSAGASGGYLKEVQFYLDLADRVSIRVPHCFYGACADDSASFVLLLEDMAPAVQGDQLAGCSPEQARDALVNLAGLHAPLWCDDQLFELPMFPTVDPEMNAFSAELMRGTTPGFIERYQDRLAPEHAEVLLGVADRFGDFLDARTERFAPVHMDYRLDNLLFAPAGSPDPVCAVDWQTVVVGNPGRDVGYFLGNGLTVDDRRAHERRLVADYHEALLAQGVAGYDADTCWDDYRLGHLQGPMTTVLGAMFVEQTDRGDDMFMAMAERTCAAIADLDVLAMF